MRPYDGGLEINQVIVYEIGGYLPFFAKKIVAKIASQSGTRLTDKIIHGIVPKSLFDARAKE